MNVLGAVYAKKPAFFDCSEILSCYRCHRDTIESCDFAFLLVLCTSLRMQRTSAFCFQHALRSCAFSSPAQLSPRPLIRSMKLSDCHGCLADLKTCLCSVPAPSS